MPRKRKAISDKIRFEVFKRDSFTCQYCGESAPRVVLNVDHIEPVASGGGNELVNLITSCRDCNGGKSDVRLSDESALAKQKKQLDELNERRSQLEMMAAWRMGMVDLDKVESDGVAAYFCGKFGCSLNDSGKAKISAAVSKFGSKRVYDAVDKARVSYRDAEYAIGKIGGICAIVKRSESDPAAEHIARCKGMLLSRGFYVGHGTLDAVVRKSLSLGAKPEDLFDAIREARNWTKFLANVCDLDRRLEGGG